MAEQEQATRDLVTRLIDGFVEAGSCDFMADFAGPLPGLVFFEMFLHAPPEEVDEINASPRWPRCPPPRGATLA